MNDAETAILEKFEDHHSEVKQLIDRVMADAKAVARRSDDRLTEIEQKITRRPGGGPMEVKSLGQRFVEDPKVKAFLASSERSGLVAASVERKTITSASNSGGGLVAVDNRVNEPIPLPQQTFAIRQLLGQGQTNSNTVALARVTARTNSAAPVAEGALKPQSDLTFDEVQGIVRTLAHVYKASRQILDDAPALASVIDGESRYGLQLVEEGQLLYGDGTGQNLQGMIPLATAFNPAIYSIPSATNIDVLMQAILQSMVAKLPATGIVLHPIDWAKILTTKDGTGRYIVGDPLNGGTGTRYLWGLPVSASLSMAPGTFLVGNLAQNCQIFDRQTIEVLLSTEDQDNFVRNFVTIRAEERLTMIVKRPQALISGSFPA